MPTNETGRAVRLSALDTSFLIPPVAGTPPIALSEQQLTLPMFERVHAQTDFNPEASNGDIRGATPQDVFDTLFVTGVRYDACATAAFHGPRNDSVPASSCHEEFRLIVQPHSGGGSFGDAAMHLVYDVEDGAEVRDALRRMRVACNGDASDEGLTDDVPVGIHPCMESDPEFIETHVTQGLLERFANPDQLQGIATMVTVANAGIEWHWELLVRGPSGLVVLPVLPNEPASDRRGVITFRGDGSFMMADQVDSEGRRLQPTTTLAEPGRGEVRSAAIERITTVRSADELDLDDPEIQEALIAAYIGENPRLSKLSDAASFAPMAFSPEGPPARVDGADCITCHVQSPILTVLEDSGLLDRLEENPGLRDRIDAVAYKPLDRLADEHWSTARDSQRGFLVNGNYLVINFGFLFSSPSVNRRVQHEAEDVALDIELRLRDADTPEPSDSATSGGEPPEDEATTGTTSATDGDDIVADPGNCCLDGFDDNRIGCDNAEIEACVCDLEPFCCQTLWSATDPNCVGIANTQCAAGCAELE